MNTHFSGLVSFLATNISVKSLQEFRLQKFGKMSKLASDEWDTIRSLYPYRWYEIIGYTVQQQYRMCKLALRGKIRSLKAWSFEELLQGLSGELPQEYREQRPNTEVQFRKIREYTEKYIRLNISTMSVSDINRALSVPKLATSYHILEFGLCKPAPYRGRTVFKGPALVLPEEEDPIIAPIQDIDEWMMKDEVEVITLDDEVEVIDSPEITEELDMENEEREEAVQLELESMFSNAHISEEVPFEKWASEWSSESDFECTGLTPYNFRDHLVLTCSFVDNYSLKVFPDIRIHNGILVKYEGVLLATRNKGESLFDFAQRVRFVYHETRIVTVAPSTPQCDAVDYGKFSELDEQEQIQESGLVRTTPPPQIASIPFRYEQAIIQPKVIMTFQQNKEFESLKSILLRSVAIQAVFSPLPIIPPPPPPLPVFGPLTKLEYEQVKLKELITQRELDDDERKAKNRRRNGDKIERRARQEHKRYNVFVAKYGLSPFPEVLINVTRGMLKESSLEFILSAQKSHIIRDVQEVILRFMLFLHDASRTNEERSEAESRHEGWTKTTKRADNIASMQVIVGEGNTKESRKRTIGQVPVYMFILTHQGFKSCSGRAAHSVAVYFAIRRKDQGINARMTHTIPSAWRKINQLGQFQRVVGYNSEPVLARTYPHGLELEDWTVFRVNPTTVSGENTHHLFWFTFYNADGIIATRPFTYAKKAFRSAHSSIESDIANICQDKITILDIPYPLAKIYDMIK